MKRLQIVILLCFLTVFSASGQNSKLENPANQILVLPGCGLVFGKDTVKLYKTTESEIYQIFQIKDILTEIGHGTACGYDENGNSASWDTYYKEINYDGIVFNYSGSSNKDNFVLNEIEIKDTTHFIVKINDFIILGRNMPNVLKYFPKRSKYDEYSIYWKNLDSYGIRLGLDDNGVEKKLSYISISMAIGKGK